MRSLNLPVRTHLCRVDGETVVRAYSPVSHNDDLGYFELVIKVCPLPTLLPTLSSQLPRSDLWRTSVNLAECILHQGFAESDH